MLSIEDDNHLRVYYLLVFHDGDNSILGDSPMYCYYTRSSYSTIILYSRDHKGVGVAHEIISPKNQPQFPRR